MVGCGVGDADGGGDDGEDVDVGGLVVLERMDLVLGFGGWPVCVIRLVGRATVRLVGVVIVD